MIAASEELFAQLSKNGLQGERKQTNGTGSTGKTETEKSIQGDLELCDNYSFFPDLCGGHQPVP